MDAISLGLVTVVIQLLGLPGLVFIIWHFDNKRDQRKEELRLKEMAERKEALAATLNQYRADVAGIKQLYKNNAHLVEDYSATCKRLEKLYSETMSVMSLNTQTLTNLVNTTKNNQFCPIVRKETGN